MKPPFKHIKPFQNLLFGLLGIVLLYFAFRSQSVEEIWGALGKVDWRWPLLIMLISMVNHIIRVLRWKQLLQPLQYHPKTLPTFMALMFGYLVNMAVPRLGEVSRCLALQRSEQVPFRPAFGTVITERLIDIACLALTILLAIVLEYQKLYEFYMAEIYPAFEILFQEKSFGVRIAGMIGVLLACIALAYFLAQWTRLRKKAWGRLLWRFLRQLWRGMMSIYQLPNPWLFIFYTSFIWGTYFLMTYLWFFCFEETSFLSWQTGIVMLCISSIGRSLPIQGGGMGAYHYLFTQGMLLYGVSATYGAALAIMVHGLQTLYYLLAGGVAMLWFMPKRG